MRIFNLILMGALLAAPVTQAQQPLTKQKCALVFPGADACTNVRVSGDQLLGDAWDQGYAPGEEKFLGHVVQRSLTIDSNEFNVLVGIATGGAITRVVIENDRDIAPEFLAQFEGKKAGDEFAIARQPEDLLYVPVMIKAMKGKMELSETIARTVHEMLLTARQMFQSDTRS